MTDTNPHDLLIEHEALNIDLTPEHTARKQGDDKDLHPEVIAAYRYVESVLNFADVPSSKIRGPLWFGWALREAFLAGCSHTARALLDQPEPEVSTDEELRRRFLIWWNEEGSAMRPHPDHDYEEHARRISEIAWANGAYVARWGK